MFLVYNKDNGLVLQASETEPVLAKGQDYVFAHDPELNLSNYEAIRVVAKEGCHLELKPTAEWHNRVSGGSNITLDEKVAKLEQYSLVLMEALAKLSEATSGGVSAELMAELVLAGKRTIDQVPADIQKDVSSRVGIVSEL
ncbi:MAG: hypothetical protein M1609_05370 [Firmicutes bacterium]|nr:hypothetical protein [Bacillota bacterium]